MNRELATAAALIGGTVLWTLWHTRSRTLPLAPVAPRPVFIAPEVAHEPIGRNWIAPAVAAVVAAKTVTPQPQDDPAFGLDSQRNADTIGVDDYMALPLEGPGLKHENRDKYEDLGATGTTEPEAFPFYRLKITETRDPFAHYAAIGGLKFLNGTKVVEPQGMMRWNPHTGETAPFSGTEEWRETNQRELIVKFPRPIVATRYQIRTSAEGTSFDPVRWTLEGSRNGAYWLALDNREEALPLERTMWANYLIRR